MWTVFYRDLWGPVWPNLAASLVCLPPAFLWHHRHIRRHVDRAIAASAQPQLADFGVANTSIEQWREQQ